MDANTLWFLGAYTAGTVFGLYMGFKGGVRKGAYTTVEHLIETNCLRTRKTSDGDVEILALDEE
jgi:hypothetical protein